MTKFRIIMTKPGWYYIQRHRWILGWKDVRDIEGSLLNFSSEDMANVWIYSEYSHYEIVDYVSEERNKKLEKLGI